MSSLSLLYKFFNPNIIIAKKLQKINAGWQLRYIDIKVVLRCVYISYYNSAIGCNDI